MSMRRTGHAHHCRRRTAVRRRRMGIPSTCAMRRRRAVRHVFFRRSRIRKRIVLPTAVHGMRCVLHFFGSWKGRRRAMMMHHRHHVIMGWLLFSPMPVLGRSLDAPQSGHLGSVRSSRLDPTPVRILGSHRRGERGRPHDMRRRRAAIRHEVLLLAVAGVQSFFVAVATAVSWHHDVDVSMIVVLLHHGDSAKRNRGDGSRPFLRRAFVVVASPLAHGEGLQRRWWRYFAVTPLKIRHGSRSACDVPGWGSGESNEKNGFLAMLRQSSESSLLIPTVPKKSNHRPTTTSTRRRPPRWYNHHVRLSTSSLYMYLGH